MCCRFKIKSQVHQSSSAAFQVLLLAFGFVRPSNLDRHQTSRFANPKQQLQQRLNLDEADRL
jgi:hypothetical protein